MKIVMVRGSREPRLTVWEPLADSWFCSAAEIVSSIYIVLPRIALQFILLHKIVFELYSSLLYFSALYCVE